MNEIETQLKALFATIDEKNAQRFGEFLSLDAQFTFANHPPVIGKTAVVEFVANFFDSIAGIKHSISDFTQTNNALLCHGHVTYTRLDSSSLTVPFCNWLYTNDTLIEKYIVFVDASELYQPQ